MIDVNDLRKGVTFEHEGNLFKVVEYSHHKPGRGNATIKIKARNLRTGSNLEKTFISGSQVQDARLDFHSVQYLYNDGDNYYFMDQETFEQPGIAKKVIGESADFLQEGMICKLTFYNGEALDVELPLTVDLKVVYAEVAVRGDTSTGVTKKVKLETGVEVQCPNFVKEGDTIRVDTRDGSYVTRV
jgi:elongation factor P